MRPGWNGLDQKTTANPPALSASRRFSFQASSQFSGASALSSSQAVFKAACPGDQIVVVRLGLIAPDADFLVITDGTVVIGGDPLEILLFKRPTVDARRLALVGVEKTCIALVML